MTPREALTRAVNRAIANGSPIVTEIRDYSHLHALEQGLSHERERLARATAPAERRLRQTWIDQREREIAAERQFLGLPADSGADMTDDELLAALQA
jgi:hypothetical protein